MAEEAMECRMTVTGETSSPHVSVVFRPRSRGSTTLEGQPTEAAPGTSSLSRLVAEKVSLQEENDYLASELAEAKLEIAQLKSSPDKEKMREQLSMPSMRTIVTGDDGPGEGSASVASSSSEGTSRLVGCLVVSGASSGVGKTLVASCVSLALQRAGVVVQPFKVGPDFLDGKHLEKFSSGGGATRRPCVNLDGWLLGGRDQCVEAFQCAARARYEGETGEEPIVALVEGCMGLYDGKDGCTEAGSTAEIAKWLGAPVILVLDCSAMARSAAAQLRGFQLFDEGIRVPATILNKVFVSGMDSVDADHPPGAERFAELQRGSPHAQWLREAIGSSAAVLGAIPIWKSMDFPERHLGLKYPSECDNYKSLDLVSRHFLDSSELLMLARSSRLPRTQDSLWKESVFPEPIARIAVAKDEAFCFYYHDNLLLLQESGAELVFFSPLRDSEVPRDVQALYIGGGYPENFAAALEGNWRMREEILAFVDCGGIVYAECGGLMYLSRSLEVTGEEGSRTHDMVGIFPFRTRMTSNAKLGYVSVKMCQRNGVFPTDAIIRGQFFHFGEVVEERVIGGLHSKSFSNGGMDQTFSLVMQHLNTDLPPTYEEVYDVKLEGLSGDLEKVAKEGYSTKSVLASFVHLHFRSNPVLASHFVGVCSLVDADELSEAFLKKLGERQSSADNEIFLNPIYNNIKSASSGGSSDGAQSLKSAESSVHKTNGRPSHERCASCSHLPHYDGGNTGSVRKGLSFNDSIPRKLKSSSSEERKRTGLQRGDRGSFSYTDIERFGLRNPSPASASGFDNVSFITIPSELAICSLSPQATEMVCALGLEERLVAVTDLCDFPIGIHQGRHVVSHSRLKTLNGNTLFGDHSHGHGRSVATSPGAKQIDSKLSEIRNKKESLFHLDVTWLSITRPGTIITQDTCKSCSPDHTTVVQEALTQAGLVDKSTKQPLGCSVLDLKAYILSDVFQHLMEIGSTCGAYESALQLVTNLRHRLRNVAKLVSMAEHKPRVISFEGISPLVLGGHWLPEMKALAGGIDPLQEPGALAQRVNWQKVRACAPEILILTPCSSSPLQTLSEVNILASMPGWWSIPAVREGQVFVIDHAFFSRPGPRVVDGIELLAHIFHPDLIKLPRKLEASRDILKFTLRNGQRCNPKQLANHFKPYFGTG